MTKIAGSGSASGSESGSISQWHGSADPDPDPDPPQNVMDPELSVKVSRLRHKAYSSTVCLHLYTRNKTKDAEYQTRLLDPKNNIVVEMVFFIILFLFYSMTYFLAHRDVVY